MSNDIEVNERALTPEEIIFLAQSANSGEGKASPEEATIFVSEDAADHTIN